MPLRQYKMLRNLSPFTRFYSQYCLNAVLLLLFALPAQADKLDLTVGYYQLEAKTSSGTAKLAGVGRFTGSYKKAINDQFDLVGGYSIYAPGGDTSDLGFGLNLGLSYFPLSPSTRSDSAGYKSTVRSVTLIRPYVSLSFHQRQYQSVQSGYAGASFGIGAEWQAFPEQYVILGSRYMALNGPLKSHVRQVSFDLGLGVMFK